MSRSRSRSRSRPGSRGSRDSGLRMMHVPSDMAGVLIGRGGEKIKALCRDTGARVEVSKDDAKDGDRTVTVTGASEAVDRAVRAIEEILQSERRSNHQPEHKKVMKVAGAFVGMIIGRGGETVKTMSRDSGAKIEVSKDDGGDRDADRTVTIIGTMEAVEKATDMIEEVLGLREEAPSEADSVIEPPPGFEECEHEQWLYNSSTQEFFSKKTGALAWLNSSTGMFCPIREGLQIPEAHFVSGTAALAETCKTVVIPDLHRVAAALKVPFDHVDKPAAMVAVFAPGAASASAEMVAPSALARAFHEKLVRRIGSWRSGWLDVAWCGAVTGAMMDLPGGGRRPMAAVLQLGRRVVAASFDAAMAILESGEAVQQMDLQGYKCCFQVLPKDSQDSVLVTGLVAGADLEQHALSTALSRSAYGAARPRASALALARLAKGEAPNVAAAWARLSLEGDKFSVAPQQKEKLNKVRVRQILIRYWTGKGPQPLNPVARRPVARKLHEAELELLEILDQLLSESCRNFPQLCKASSECGSAMRGGADNGDLGWLDEAKVAALAKAKGLTSGGPKSVVQLSVPVAVVKTAFGLEKGELSDVVVSEIGVHLVQRTG
ncbi:unnamed protein product [Effrenium voratum]|nr:unnamed protein product [Effrenium voratum]